MPRPKTVAVTAGVIVVVAMSPVTALAATGPSQQDLTWMKASAAGDLFEIQGGKMAQVRGQSAMVKQLGARLASDHTKSSTDVKKLAEQLKVTLPTHPDSKQRAELAQLAKLHGAAFDKQYVKTEIDDHKMDIADARKQIATGSNSQVVDEARKNLPVLQTHLKLAEQAQATVGGQ